MGAEKTTRKWLCGVSASNSSAPVIMKMKKNTLSLHQWRILFFREGYRTEASVVDTAKEYHSTFSRYKDHDTTYPSLLTLAWAEDELGKYPMLRGKHPSCEVDAVFSEKNRSNCCSTLSPWNQRRSQLSLAQAKKRCPQTLLRRQGQLQKPDPISGLSTAESYLIKGERELARTDCTLAPPSVNYTGPCCHWNLQGNFSDHRR